MVLIRDSQTGPHEPTAPSWDPEIFLLVRRPDLALAAGHAAFPGGAVEDGDADLPMTGRPDWNVEWASRLGCDPRQAAALAGCAAREVFEETGTLLATTPAGPVEPRAVSEQTRSDLLVGSTTFARLLEDLGARIDVDTLLPWSRWVTPVWSPRRYDTLVLLAQMPAGVCPATDGGGEATTAGWRRPGDALDMVASKQLQMLTPTSDTLRDIDDVEGKQELWTRRPPLTPHTFTHEMVDSGRVTVTLDGPAGRRVVTTFDV